MVGPPPTAWKKNLNIVAYLVVIAVTASTITLFAQLSATFYVSSDVALNPKKHWNGGALDLLALRSIKLFAVYFPRTMLSKV